jgi:hypothetical protein
MYSVLPEAKAFCKDLFIVLEASGLSNDIVRSFKNKVIQEVVLSGTFEAKDVKECKKYQTKLKKQVLSSQKEQIKARIKDQVQALDNMPPALKAEGLERIRRAIERESGIDQVLQGDISRFLKAEIESVNNRINLIQLHLNMHTKTAVDASPSPKKGQQSLEDVTSSSRREYILTMMEHLKVTVNGKSVLPERKKSVIAGIATALLKNSLVSPVSRTKLTQILANEIQLVMGQKVDWSDSAEEFRKKVETYLKSHPLP